jgi:chromate transporter
MSQGDFLDLFGVANLLPGPSSTELAIFIGFRQAGWPGLIAAGVCFILPAACIVTALAWAYVRLGALPVVAGLLYGVKPVVIAVVLQAVWRLGRSALKTRWLMVVSVVSLVAAVAGVDALAALALGSILAVLPEMRQTGQREGRLVAASAGIGPVASGAAAFGLWPLFLVFLKMGAVLFGSGYVLLAFLHGDLIQRLGWLTDQQLLDAVAVGQVTPGPVFTTATFIGYILGGVPGALVATVAIFLPSFLFVAVSGPFIRKVRNSPIAAAALDGVTVASLALMAVVTWQLGRAALTDLLALVITGVSALLLFRYRLNAAWLVLMGAAVGLLTSWLR